MTNIKIVIGANYGDEGKGLMTDYFCNEATQREESALVVCDNGGSQRGHTVTTPDGKRHVFHHFGSGTFVGADTYLSENFILNPMNYHKEYLELADMVKCMPTIYINRKCKVTTPFEMIINQMAEESRGDNKYGSCGCGIWETIVTDGATVEKVWEMYLEGKLEDYIKTIRDSHLPGRLKELNVEMTDEWKEVIYKEDLIKNWIHDFYFMMRTSEWETDNIIKEYDNVIFENGQGLMLNQRYMHFNYATPSETGVRNPAQMILKVFWGMYDDINVETCYVTRPYITRHGPGELDNECTREDVFEKEDDETNVYNAHQGEFRYAKMCWSEFGKRVKHDHSYFDVGTVSIALTHFTALRGCDNIMTFLRAIEGNNYRRYYCSTKTRNGVKM